MATIKINNREIGTGYLVYVIAEIGSNFDGSLKRAKELAKKCKDAGANAYKIQNFIAEKIVSAEGFKNLQVAHQAKWDMPVVEVYRKAEFPREWLKELSDYCAEIGIDFFSSPYDTDAVDELEKINTPAYKIGSGEIDNLEFIAYIARLGKPVIIAAGSATLDEVEAAINTVRKEGNDQVVLLQCVTNYPSPISDANLKAMVTMGERFGVLYGYSDHTTGTNGGGDDPLDGLTIPLAMTALGGCMIEKHVTDDTSRSGPDHPFAMTIDTNFAEMIAGIRAVETALGDGKKKIEPSEKETIVIQRRGFYATRDIAEGEAFTPDSIHLLRPAIGLRPRDTDRLLNSRARHVIPAGSPITNDDIC